MKTENIIKTLQTARNKVSSAAYKHLNNNNIEKTLNKQIKKPDTNGKL